MCKNLPSFCSLGNFWSGSFWCSWDWLPYPPSGVPEWSLRVPSLCILHSMMPLITFFFHILMTAHYAETHMERRINLYLSNSFLPLVPLPEIGSPNMKIILYFLKSSVKTLMVPSQIQITRHQPDFIIRPSENYIYYIITNIIQRSRSLEPDANPLEITCCQLQHWYQITSST